MSAYKWNVAAALANAAAIEREAGEETEDEHVAQDEEAANKCRNPLCQKVLSNSYSFFCEENTMCQRYRALRLQCLANEGAAEEDDLECVRVGSAHDTGSRTIEAREEDDNEDADGPFVIPRRRCPTATRVVDSSGQESLVSVELGSVVGGNSGEQRDIPREVSLAQSAASSQTSREQPQNAALTRVQHNTVEASVVQRSKRARERRELVARMSSTSSSQRESGNTPGRKKRRISTLEYFAAQSTTSSAPSLRRSRGVITHLRRSGSVAMYPGSSSRTDYSCRGEPLVQPGSRSVLCSTRATSNDWNHHIRSSRSFTDDTTTNSQTMHRRPITSSCRTSYVGYVPGASLLTNDSSVFARPQRFIQREPTHARECERHRILTTPLSSRYLNGSLPGGNESRNVNYPELPGRSGLSYHPRDSFNPDRPRSYGSDNEVSNQRYPEFHSSRETTQHSCYSAEERGNLSEHLPVSSSDTGITREQQGDDTSIGAESFGVTRPTRSLDSVGEIPDGAECSPRVGRDVGLLMSDRIHNSEPTFSCHERVLQRVLSQMIQRLPRQLEPVMNITKHSRKLQWYLQHRQTIEHAGKPYVQIRMQSSKVVMTVQGRVWLKQVGSPLKTLLHNMFVTLRSEVVLWRELKHEVEKSLQLYRDRHGDDLDLSSTFLRAWNDFKDRCSATSLPRQTNYFCGARLHHWTFVVARVEIGSGSHEEKREAFRLASISAAKFLLLLDDGRNDQRWRPADFADANSVRQVPPVSRTSDGQATEDRSSVPIIDLTDDEALPEVKPSSKTETEAERLPTDDGSFEEQVAVPSSISTEVKSASVSDISRRFAEAPATPASSESFVESCADISAETVESAATGAHSPTSAALSESFVRECSITSTEAVQPTTDSPAGNCSTTSPEAVESDPRQCMMCELIQLRKSNSARCRRCQNGTIGVKPLATLSGDVVER